MAYTLIGWTNDQAPAINQTNLNKMDNELLTLDQMTEDLQTALDEVTEMNVSVNMYNYKTRNISKQFKTSSSGYGTLIDSSTYDVSDYIEIDKTKTYKIGCFLLDGTALRTNSYTCRFIAEYDSEYNMLGSLINGNDMTDGIYTPVSNDAKYVRFQMTKDVTTYKPATDDIFAVSTAFPSSYVPYYSNLVVVLPDEIAGLPDRVDAIESELSMSNTVVYWGDSLTAGNQDGSGVTRATVMQSLLGNDWVVKNFGSGGETANTIAARQGGNNLLVTAGQTIPASGDASLEITDRNGASVNLRSSIESSYAQSESVNPCSIGGVVGVLSRGATFGASPYKFTRAEAGSAVSIDRPTCVITNGMTNYAGKIVIIEIGQNGGYTDADDLVRQIQEMININGIDKYIVCGFTTYNHPTENSAMALAFGRHFINTLEYAVTPIYSDGQIVSCYGLADMGITPTETDLERIADGQMPKSLLVEADNIHLNQYGYTMQANLEYKRGHELGYW